MYNRKGECLSSKIVLHKENEHNVTFEKEDQQFLFSLLFSFSPPLQ